MNTPPSSQQSGVQAPDGYQTSTEQMSGVGRTIATKAEDAKGEIAEVQPAKVQPAEFGQHEEHQAWHADYAAAVVQLGTGAGAMCDNLVAFAGQLDAAGATYSDSESSAQTNVNSVQV
ncbi:hypothetical protein [Actinophytocola glycyrrhizae]|uniref:Excreted virulence factor EspC (Type VII ESX diderm) n=1 Tax=Actinophytocola glycyrrhizae TaxID=2044873 RepID=A0ABV9S1F8_9PSEU